MRNKRIISAFAVAAVAIPFAISCNSHDKTCSIIKDNYRTYVYFNTNTEDYDAKTPSKIKGELIESKVNGVDTYKFIDINYNECKTRSSWAAAGHLSRALKIAIVAEDRDSNELRDIAKKLTLHWVLSNYHNINWWQNELGANSTLANLGLFTFDYLGKKGQDAFNGKIRESSLKWRPSVSTHTGANVFDYIDITCRNAAINNDKEEMTIAVNRLADEITDINVEGFQTDGSFFQHGRQVQNVSYGKSVVRVGKTLYNLRGTDYKIPDEKMKIISNYILKGLRFSTFKGYTNYNTVSREYSRPNNLDTLASGLNDLVYYEGVSNYPDTYKEATYGLVDSFKKRKNAVTEDTVQYFDKAKMIVCNIGHKVDGKAKDGIYISYKGTEPNLTNTECVNGENQLGLNLSYGTNTCVMDYGTEYYNIAPLLDYNYMPGTTSPLYGGSIAGYDYKTADDTIINYSNKVYGDGLYEHKVPKFIEGTNEYVYNDGVNGDVTYSMTKTQHHERGDYTVTCFATIYGMVLVGSNISYTKKAGDPEDNLTGMHTTIDQYITDDKPTSSSVQGMSFNNHEKGNVKYTSLNNVQLDKDIKARTYTDKDWTRNNRDYKYKEDSEPTTKNVATIIANLDDNKGYAYSIQDKDEKNDFILAANNSKVHAIVLPNGKIAAAFYYKDGKFTYDSQEYTLPESIEFIPGKGAFVIMDKKV